MVFTNIQSINQMEQTNKKIKHTLKKGSERLILVAKKQNKINKVNELMVSGGI